MEIVVRENWLSIFFVSGNDDDNNYNNNNRCIPRKRVSSKREKN